MLTVLVGEPASSAGSTAQAGIAALLEERAEAILDEDQAAFMETVDPSAPVKFKQRQRALFQGFVTLDLAEYDLYAAWDRMGDLVRPAANEQYPGSDLVSLPLTIERYRLKGMDPQPAFEEFFYTYISIEGHWFIASDTDLEDVGLYSARHLWDTGPIESYATERFTYYSHPCAVDCIEIEEMGRQSERAFDLVARYWRQIPDRTAVLVPGDVSELERMIQSTFDLDNFVAFAYSSEDPELGFTGNRVMLNPDSFRGIDPDYAFSILAHEMLHIATRKAAGPFVPIFVEEGFAEYVATDASPDALSLFRSDVAAGSFDGKVPLDFEFTTGTNTDIYRSYQESLASVHFFIERWGVKEFVSFYRRLGAVVSEPGTTRYWVDRSLRETTGIGLERFQEQWADSIASR